METSPSDAAEAPVEVVAPAEDDLEGEEDPREGRAKDYSGWASLKPEVGRLYDAVVQAFQDKNSQITNIQRYWQVYNCELTTNQAYQGNAAIYLPLVRDAVEARVTRWMNMLFPENEQHVDVVSFPGDLPHGLMALLNHYVKTSRLRHIAPALLRNGEVEGHYGLYWSWQRTERYVTKKIVRMAQIDIGGGEPIDDPDNTFMDVEDDVVVSEHPAVDLIPLADLAVIPPTADTVEDADACARILRLTKDGIRAYQRRGFFSKSATERLIAMFPVGDPPPNESVVKKKIEAAGINERGEYAMIYEAWGRFMIDGKRRWCRLFFGGEDNGGQIVLGFTVNPNWNDLCSIVSVPRTKIADSHYGKSPIDAVEQLQYQANDACNMGMDSAQFSLMPIVLTDPRENPNYASMVLSLAAVWQTSPASTQFAQFPPLWRDALEIVAGCKSQIMQSFGLNPAMMPQGATPRKPTQAETAQEAAVAIETTANEVTMLEEAVFSPLLHRFFELDQQHRDVPLTVRIYGQMGLQAQMEQVPAFAWDDRYEFRWRGVEVFRSAQQNQNMIAAMNVLRSLPPVLPDGKRIEIGPIIETLVENTFGPRLGSRILVDVRDQLAVDPQRENEILVAGMIALPIHFMDDDMAHLQAHMQAARETGDPTGFIRTHMIAHASAMQQKQAQMMPQGAMGGPPGEPGQPGPSAGVNPGVPGTPRPGAQPLLPRGGQAPPGAIHQDQLQDAGRVPRPGRA